MIMPLWPWWRRGGISILPELVLRGGTAEYTADRIEGEELQIARHCRKLHAGDISRYKRFLNYVEVIPSCSFDKEALNVTHTRHPDSITRQELRS